MTSDRQVRELRELDGKTISRAFRAHEDGRIAIVFTDDTFLWLAARRGPHEDMVSTDDEPRHPADMIALGGGAAAEVVARAKAAGLNDAAATIAALADTCGLTRRDLVAHVIRWLDAVEPGLLLGELDNRAALVEALLAREALLTRSAGPVHPPGPGPGGNSAAGAS